MLYHSTQDKSQSVSSAQAIAQGISKDGGLFVPESFPKLSLNDLDTMLTKTYQQRAKMIISKYLTDFSPITYPELSLPLSFFSVRIFHNTSNASSSVLPRVR